MEAQMAQATPNLSRRSLIGTAIAAAAVPAAVIPQAWAAEVDPIFARIEAYRVADRAYNAALHAYSDWGNAPAVADARDHYDKALIAFFNTQPTSVGGVSAALEFCSEYEFGDGDSCTILDGGRQQKGCEAEAEGYLITLATTLRRLARAA
jgi:hypothetical protein